MKALQTRLQSCRSSIETRCKCRSKRPVDLTGDRGSPKRQRLTIDKVQKVMQSRPAACDLMYPSPVVSIAEEAPELDDVVLRHLQQEYEEMNNRVVKGGTKTDAGRRDDYRARDLALVKLGVHIWRHQYDELVQMIGSKPTTDQTHLHRKCVLMASAAHEAHEEVAKLRTKFETHIQKERLTDMRRIGEQLTGKEIEMRAIEKAWCHEVATLLQASPQLKKLLPRTGVRT